MFSDLKNAVLRKEIDTHKNNRLRRISRIYISRIYLATQIEYIQNTQNIFKKYIEYIDIKTKDTKNM